MAPRKKNGRATAEAAYADLHRANAALVGDVGEAFDVYIASLEAAALARERFEDARAAAVKAGAVTNDQLEQMGYKKTAKLPAPPTRPAEQGNHHPGASSTTRTPSPQTNGSAPVAPQRASASAAPGEGR